MQSDDVVEQATAQLGHMAQLMNEVEARNARLEEELSDARARLAEQAKAWQRAGKAAAPARPRPSLAPRRARRARGRPPSPPSPSLVGVGPAELGRAHSCAHRSSRRRARCRRPRGWPRWRGAPASPRSAPSGTGAPAPCSRFSRRPSRRRRVPLCVPVVSRRGALAHLQGCRVLRRALKRGRVSYFIHVCRVYIKTLRVYTEILTAWTTRESSGTGGRAVSRAR